MTPQQQRDAVKAAYSGTAWKTKVSKMPESQVTAIYLNLKSQGRV